MKQIQIPKKIQLLGEDWTVEQSKDWFFLGKQKVHGTCSLEDRKIEVRKDWRELETFFHELSHARRQELLLDSNEGSVQIESKFWLQIFKNLFFANQKKVKQKKPKKRVRK